MKTRLFIEIFLKLLLLQRLNKIFKNANKFSSTRKLKEKGL